MTSYIQVAPRGKGQRTLRSHDRRVPCHHRETKTGGGLLQRMSAHEDGYTKPLPETGNTYAGTHSAESGDGKEPGKAAENTKARD